MLERDVKMTRDSCSIEVITTTEFILRDDLENSKPKSPYAPYLPGYICCRVCGMLWKAESAVAPTIRGHFTPTETRGNIPVCRYGSCQAKLDAEINRLIKLDWKGLYPRPGFVPPRQEKYVSPFDGKVK